MYLRRCHRARDGKRHAYWALVKSVRTSVQIRGPGRRANKGAGRTGGGANRGGDSTDTVWLGDPKTLRVQADRASGDLAARARPELAAKPGKDRFVVETF